MVSEKGYLFNLGGCFHGLECDRLSPFSRMQVMCVCNCFSHELTARSVSKKLAHKDPPDLRCIGQQPVKRCRARRSESEIHFPRSRESNKHESNAPGRRRTRNIGCDRFGLRRFYRHSRKEDRRYRPDPSLQERTRDYPDSTDPLLGRDCWRRCPDLRRVSQNGVNLAIWPKQHGISSG